MNPNASESLIHGHCPVCGTIQPVRGSLVEPHKDRGVMALQGNVFVTSYQKCGGSGMKPVDYSMLPEIDAPSFVPGGGRRF